VGDGELTPARLPQVAFSYPAPALRRWLGD